MDPLSDAPSSNLSICLAQNNITLPSPIWFPNRSAMEIMKLVVNIFGIFGNLTLFIILQRKQLGSRLATLFFSCQSILDLIVCLMSAIQIIQPAMWLGGHSDFGNILVCRGWHSLVFYLFFIQFSILNIVLIGLERYWAVVHPFMYQKLRVHKHGVICIVVILIVSMIFAIPNLWETQYRRICDVGICIGQVFTPGIHMMLKVYSVMWFIFMYALPLLMLVFFYGRLIYQLNSSRDIARCTKKDQAAEQFTRMAIVVTIVYVLCITYDAFAYMLGRTGIWQYNYGTIEHQLGMFVISVNSCANPYVYFFFVMRSSFLRLIRRRPRRRSRRNSSMVSEYLFKSIGRSSTMRSSSISSNRVGRHATYFAECSDKRNRLQSL